MDLQSICLYIFVSVCSSVCICVYGSTSVHVSDRDLHPTQVTSNPRETVFKQINPYEYSLDIEHN